MLDVLVNYLLIALLLLIPIAMLVGVSYVLFRPLEDMEKKDAEAAPEDPPPPVPLPRDPTPARPRRPRRVA